MACPRCMEASGLCKECEEYLYGEERKERGMKTFSVHVKQEGATFNVKAEQFHLDVQIDGGAVVASYFFTTGSEEDSNEVTVASFPYDNVLAVLTAS